MKNVTDMSLSELTFASADIRETLAIWKLDKPINDPYMAKLWRQFDSVVVERHRRTLAS